MADVLTFGGSWLNFGGSIITLPDPGVPEYTVRVQFTDTSYVPTSAITGGTSAYGTSWTAVDASQGIWDCYANKTSWRNLFNLTHSIIGANNYAKVLSANIGSTVTDITYMFNTNDALTEVHNFRSSANLLYVYTGNIFYRCRYLTSAQVDMSGADSISSIFQGCTRLTDIDITTTNTLVYARSAFSGCSALVSAPQLVTDNLRYANNMFDACTALATVPNYTTSSCVDMSYMFRGCSNMAMTSAQVLDMGNATDTTEMFKNCTNLTSININPHKATSLAKMFQGCTNLTSVIVSGAQSQSGNALDTSYMFHNCSKLTSITGGFINTSSVTTMRYMFYECARLTAIPSMNTSSVVSMSNMLYNCNTITSVQAFSTGNVTDFTNFMFNCWSVTSLPTFDTHSATSLFQAFANCGNINAVPLLNTSSVTDMSWAFYRCLRVASGALALYQQASSQTTPPSTYASCFYNCGQNTTTGLQDLNQIPTSWGGYYEEPVYEICPGCGEQSYDGSYCSNCGYAAPVYETCPNCGEQAYYNGYCESCGYGDLPPDTGDQYCPNCGEQWDGIYCSNCDYPPHEEPPDEPFPGGVEFEDD